MQNAAQRSLAHGLSAAQVQPFVALARGLCDTHNMLVTIVGEQPYREFVLKKGSDVTSGAIRFLPCGGLRCGWNPRQLH